MKGHHINIMTILFILLSVLTIIGTAIPTTIVAVPDQTNENIRVKRGFMDIVDAISEAGKFVVNVAVEAGTTVVNTVKNVAENCLATPSKIVSTGSKMLTNYEAASTGAVVGATVGGGVGSLLPGPGTAIGTVGGALYGAVVVTTVHTIRKCAE